MDLRRPYMGIPGDRSPARPIPRVPGSAPMYPSHCGSVRGPAMCAVTVPFKILRAFRNTTKRPSAR